MKDERLGRAERLVALRNRAVESAQAALSRCVQEVSAARSAAETATLEWEARAELSGRRYSTSADLADDHAWLRTLRVRADQAAIRLAAARAEEDASRVALSAARLELRKVEAWRDGLAAAARAVEARKERVANDEVAARVARREA